MVALKRPLRRSKESNRNISVIDDTILASHGMVYEATIKNIDTGHKSNVRIHVDWQDVQKNSNLAYFSLDEKYKERLRELAKDIFSSLENVAEGINP